MEVRFELLLVISDIPDSISISMFIQATDGILQDLRQPRLLCRNQGQLENYANSCQSEIAAVGFCLPMILQ